MNHSHFIHDRQIVRTQKQLLVTWLRSISDTKDGVYSSGKWGHGDCRNIQSERRRNWGTNRLVSFL